MAVPEIARAALRWFASGYARQPRADEIRQFLEQAVNDTWEERGWRGLARLFPSLVRDLVRVHIRGAALPITAPPSAHLPALTTHARSSMADRLLADVRHARRALVRSPAFTVLAIATLALGIGASTAVYAVVDGAILRPFPYPDMASIVLLSEQNRGNGEGMSVSWQNFQDWRARNQVFRELGVYRGATLNLSGGSDAPERLSGALVSASIFDTTGIPPLRGRVFTAADDERGAARTAVISERLWRGRFSAREEVVGSTLVLNSEAHVVVGIMPAGMRFPSRVTDVWVPLGLFVDTFPASRGAHPGLTAAGRMKNGVSLADAQAAMDVIARQLEQEYPETNRNNGVVVDSYHEAIVRDIRPAMQMLLGAVGLLLLIACANLAGLLLARTGERHRELAVRAALGAGRRRLLRQLLVESAALALAGGTLGVLLAHAAVTVFVAARPSTIPRVDLIAVDWRVLLFAIVVSLATIVLFGLLPAWRASAPDLQQTLRDVRSSPGVRALRWRRAIVIAQLTVAVVLLVGAGLLTRSLTRLLSIDIGFDPAQVVTMRVALPPARHATPEAWTTFFERLLEGVAATAGVQAIGINSAVPLEGGAAESPVMKEGDPPPGPDTRPVMCMFQTASGGYFGAMGIPIVRGRTFDARDRRDGPLVVVVDESLVERLFGGADPIGTRIAFEAEGETLADLRPIWREVIGVVGTVKHYGLLSTRPYVQVYVPHTQLPLYQRDRRPAMAIVAKANAAADPDAVVASIRHAVTQIDPTIPVYGVQPMRQYVDAATEQPRMASGLLAAFAAIALTLAVIGVYGTLSYIVALRTREIGVRMALGAGRRDILRHVVRQGLVLTGVGLAVGLGVALIASRWIENQLYQVSPTDTGTYLGVAAILGVVATVASVVPARRASRVDPLIALRSE